MTNRRPPGTYGFDAPFALAAMAIGGAVALVIGIVLFAFVDPLYGPVWLTAYGVLLLVGTVVFLYTTRRGKFAVWADLLDELTVDPDSVVLDMGCGRGAVLVMAADRLRNGRAIGVDLWRGVDQSGNDASATTRNAQAAGVADRVRVCTGDMSRLPLTDGAVDVVVSALAIHNISDVTRRGGAVREAARAVKPGGRVMLVDIRHIPQYARILEECGLADVQRRRLGWRYSYGGPWAAPSVVTATRPRSGTGR